MIQNRNKNKNLFFKYFIQQTLILCSKSIVLWVKISILLYTCIAIPYTQYSEKINIETKNI